MSFIIKDWISNEVFPTQAFDSIESASEYLTEFIETKYPHTKNDENAFNEEFNEYQILEEK